MSDLEQHDSKKRRCPRLGHELSFAYCRCPGTDTPCKRILDCWWETFEVEAFVREHYGEEALAEIAQPPRPKVASLIDLIQQAQERTRRNT
ncbi:MAG: hypothetical protein ACLFVU_08930 [Phycisphaerae bacterium]